VRAAILGCQRVTVWPSSAAGDASLPVAGGARRRLPGAIVRHRPFDREHTAVVVGNDQEDGRGVRRTRGNPTASQRHAVAGSQPSAAPRQSRYAATRRGRPWREDYRQVDNGLQVRSGSGWRLARGRASISAGYW